MLHSFREQYNREFTSEKYEQMLRYIHSEHGISPKFRIAETPVFIPKKLKNQLVEACTDIANQINQADFKEKTEGAFIRKSLKIPNENAYSHFLQMDFAICQDKEGELSPQLIEMQGFPSLYFFQELLSRSYQEIFSISKEFSSHLGGLSGRDYLDLLRNIILEEEHPENVVLLEVDPKNQTTYIDFLACKKQTGTPILCISDLIKRGKKLYYKNDQGIEVPIHRIFNRVIFDELNKRKDIKSPFRFQDEVDVEWVGHPSWFFRISKFTMPLLDNPYVPPSNWLHKIDQYPEHLDNYVLKPLFSFAGSGVDLHPTIEKLDAIQDRNNYILQKKKNYVPIIETTSDLAKCEIRMLMLWDKKENKYQIVNNLVRLSKGEMIGVRFNKDRDWVGGSVGYFQD